MSTVIFDCNNLVIRNIFSPDVITKNSEKTIIDVDWDTWRLYTFSSIYNSMFAVKNVSEIIVAIDSRKSWRHDVWSRYKESRKGKRDTSTLDWDKFFEKYDELIDDFKTHFPFKFLKIDKCEADDIIGVITLNTDKKIHIISTDKDFLQLSCDRVSLYNPLKKMNVSHPNPDIFLIEQTLLGQKKDDIFNIKTPLDWPHGKRKPGFGPSALEKVMVYGWRKWLDDNDLVDRFKFNLRLMDFRMIPDEIKEMIMKEYSEYKLPAPNKIYEFFKENNWPTYLDKLTAVENKLYQLY